MEARMAFEPTLHIAMFVGRVVVHDEVDIEVIRGVAVDFAQEA